MPLAKSYWQSAEFVKSFHASYRTQARIEPYITSEEKVVLQQVQKAMAQGQRKSALQAIKSSPKTQGSAALLFNLGNIHFEEGHLESARNAYQKALKIYPSFRRAHKNLGMVQMRLEQQDQAMQSLLKAVELGDMSAGTLGLLGYCHLESGSHASALQAYQMAQVTDPNNVSWKAGIAQCLLAMNKLREGVSMIAEVYQLSPEEDGYAMLYVHALIEDQQNEKAIALLELLKKQQRLGFAQRCLLAQLHTSAGDMRMAKPHVEELRKAGEEIQLSPFLRVLESLASIAEWQYALDCLLQVEELERSEAQSQQYQSLKAQCMAQLGMQEAEPIIESLLTQNPLDGAMLLLMAKLQNQLGKPAAAEVYYERAQLLDSHAYRAYLAHGALLVDQKRYQSALGKYQAAQKIKATPEQAQYIAELSRVVGTSGL